MGTCQTLPLAQAPAALPNPLRVRIVEQHLLLAIALRAAVISTGAPAVVAEAASPSDDALLLDAPDVILLGTSCSTPECLRWASWGRGADHLPGVVALRTALNPTTALLLSRSGVHALLDDFASDTDLRLAIMAAAAGDGFCNSHLRRVLYESDKHSASALTSREFELLSLLTYGKTNKAIAAALDVTVKTVESQLTHLYEKLQVTSRSQAVVAALDLSLLEPIPSRR